jgi:hypothetical protein
MKTSDKTLEFYRTLLELDGKELEEACEPWTLFDCDTRIQELRNGRGNRMAPMQGRVENMAKHVLTKTLRNVGATEQVVGITRLDKAGEGIAAVDLILNPKIITGTVKSLSIRPVSPEELSDCTGSTPLAKKADDKIHLSNMDTFFLVEGEVKISRSIGYIASGIRLSEYEAEITDKLVRGSDHEIYELNDDEQISRVLKTDVARQNAGYVFSATKSRGKETSTSPSGAQAMSVYAARSIEAANLARPFGGMHE